MGGKEAQKQQASQAFVPLGGWGRPSFLLDPTFFRIFFFLIGQNSGVSKGGESERHSSESKFPTRDTCSLVWLESCCLRLKSESLQAG